jgi:hypothetical protein
VQCREGLDAEAPITSSLPIHEHPFMNVIPFTAFIPSLDSPKVARKKK